MTAACATTLVLLPVITCASAEKGYDEWIILVGGTGQGQTHHTPSLRCKWGYQQIHSHILTLYCIHIIQFRWIIYFSGLMDLYWQSEITWMNCSLYIKFNLIEGFICALGQYFHCKIWELLLLQYVIMYFALTYCLKRVGLLKFLYCTFIHLDIWTEQSLNN